MLISLIFHLKSYAVFKFLLEWSAIFLINL